MSAIQEKSSETEYVGAQLDAGKKKEVLVRKANLGYSTMSEYLRALIDEDLERAETSE